MRVWVLLGVTVLLACGNNAGDGADGGDAGGNGNVTLTVNSTSTPSAVGPLVPPNGTYFEELNITLGNAGVSKAISASFQFFTLQTDQALVLQFSTASDAVDTACSTSISVADGGSFTCNLVFEVPTGQKPVTLLYNDTAGDTASADVPAPPPPLTCAYDSEKQNVACQECIHDSAGGVTQAPACAAAVQEATSACSSDADRACFSQSAQTGCEVGFLMPPCGCISNCISSGCAAAYKAQMDCLYTFCVNNSEVQGNPPPCP
jgi:hypothetical protein